MKIKSNKTMYQASYLKIETDDKKMITSLIEDVIENSNGHRIYTQKLRNGDYFAEIIAQKEEPPIN